MLHNISSAFRRKFFIDKMLNCFKFQWWLSGHPDTLDVTCVDLRTLGNHILPGPGTSSRWTFDDAFGLMKEQPRRHVHAGDEWHTS